MYTGRSERYWRRAGGAPTSIRIKYCLQFEYEACPSWLCRNEEPRSNNIASENDYSFVVFNNKINITYLGTLV